MSGGTDIYFFEVRVNVNDVKYSTPLMYIGLAKKLTNFNDLCFYNVKHSFCVNTRDGNINLKQQDVKYTRRITDGENVGVYVRISTGEVWFTINGKS